ncbi:MAG: hypothetical protein HYU78_09585 [Rhodocyclales bacterium]|nr:hypothetical protein [Rhodocyclales bacterium]
MNTMTIPQAQARQLVADLEALGEQLEAQDNPLWYRAARAAAALEGMRLGVAAIEPFPYVDGGLPQ